MATPAISMTFELCGNRVTICPCEGQPGSDSAHPGSLAAIDWQMWLRVAACVASCLSSATATPVTPPTASAPPAGKPEVKK